MRRIGMSLAVCLLGSALMLPSGAGASGAPSDPRVLKRAFPAAADPDLWVEGELVVQFRRGVKRAEAASLHANRGAHRVATIDGLGPRFEHVRLSPGRSMGAAIRAYERDPRVLVVEPNLRLQPQSHILGPPTEPGFGQLWGLENTGQAHRLSDAKASRGGTSGADIDALAAWATEQGDSNPTVVAVLDSGVDVTHPDLNHNLWKNPGELGGIVGKDDDGNGCVDDLVGRQFGGRGKCKIVKDLFEHGTHVAGTIAAEANDVGVVGVCPHCKIMVLKFDFTLASELKALAYARQKGADVLNGSYGGPVFSVAERNAIKALGNDGILAVFAAANDSLDNDLAMRSGFTGGFSPAFPASYNLPNIISVAASNHHDEYAYFTGCHEIRARPKRACSFTNVGHDSVDVAAPGADIRSTVPGGKYRVYNGTSMAAPHVAGVAGLIRAANPSLPPEDVKDMIMNGADTPTSLESAYLSPGNASGDFTRTGGRINATAALAAPTDDATPLTDGNVDGASAIVLGGSATDSVAYPEDVNDVYKATLTRGSTYAVRLTVPPGKDYDLWVWSTGVREIHQFEAGCYGLRGPCRIAGYSAGGNGRDEVIRFQARRTGMHYFQVQAWFKSAGSYTLRVREV